MPLPDIRGHEEARALLERAFTAGALPQSILLHGPAGVGKERLGLWLAALLVCERDEPPCGLCNPCRLVGRLEHPDVHWFFPLQRPDASSPEKLRERLEEERAVELQRYRENPFRTPEYDKAPAHFLATMRTVQQLASLRPAAGQRKVFVIGDAEFMVPQEGNQEAANAFLKLLEEPPPETTFILTSSQPGALLPTVHSRVLSIRVGPLQEDQIAELLESAGLAAADAAAAVASRAAGSVRRALRLATNPSASETEHRVGRELLIAVLARGPVGRLAEAAKRRPAGARNELLVDLDSLSEWLRDLLAVASGAVARVSDPAAVPILERMVKQRHVPPQGIMTAIARVAEAREMAYRNINPQLLLADLLRLIQTDLQTSEAALGEAS